MVRDVTIRCEVCGPAILWRAEMLFGDADGRAAIIAHGLSRREALRQLVSELKGASARAEEMIATMLANESDSKREGASETDGS